MTVSYKKSRGDGGYYINCMSTRDGTAKVDDYYTAAIEPPGVWYSSSRKSNLGIVDGMVFGSVEGFEDAERFTNLCKGFNPEGGRKLTQNSGEKTRIALHDFTCSAPKSVSVIFSQSSDALKTKIEKSNLDASRVFLDFMATKSIARQGKGGVNQSQAPLIGAIFGHGSSRAGDPQIHHHCVIFNVVERADGTTGALETKELMKWQGAAAGLYHAQLAWDMRNLGFEIERKNNLFEIKGVPEDVLKAFSQRRAQIVAAVEDKLQSMGINSDTNKKGNRALFQQATIETRNEKSELTREQLKEIWIERGQNLGFSEKESLELMTQDKVIELNREELLIEARKAVQEITETKSVFKAPELLSKVAVCLFGKASSEQIQLAFKDIQKELLITKLDNRRSKELDELPPSFSSPKEFDEVIYTTKEMLVLEREILQFSDRFEGTHMLEKTDLLSNLNGEQLDVAKASIRDKNSVTVVQGTAGAGKTYTMSVISKIYGENGYSVTGLSSGWSAALNLKEEAKLEHGLAITGWVNSVNRGDIVINNKSLIILDEAGLVGSKQMHDVLKISKLAGAKVILLGDTLQQGSVSNGRALGSIIDDVTGCNRLDVIRRQKNSDDRDSVKKFFDGNAKEGLKIFEKRGDISINLGNSETQEAVIEAWHKSFSKTTGDQLYFHRNGIDYVGTIESNNNKKLTVRADDNKLFEIGNENLIIALDKNSVCELNELAHKKRKDANELGESKSFNTMDSKDENDLIEFSVNDEVIFRSNNKKLSIFNKNRGIIENITDSTISIKTEDGRIIDIEIEDKCWQFQGDKGGLGLQHAYATTVYSAQGLTVDNAFTKDSEFMRRETAGVSMSRHREINKIFIDKNSRYEEKMTKSIDDDWHHIDKYSDSDCISDVASSWSRKSDKSAAVDYIHWQNEGVNFDELSEIKIKNINLKVDFLDESKKESKFKFEISDIKPREEMPFQQRKEYLMKTPISSEEERRIGFEKLEKVAIERSIIYEAEKQGFLRFNKDVPVFCGLRKNGDIVYLDSEKNVLTRNLYPPILKGDTEKIDIVKSGKDGLAIWAIQDRENIKRSTIIVNKGKIESLSLPHVQSILKEAKSIKVHDAADINIELINKQSKEAAQRIQAARDVELINQAK